MTFLFVYTGDSCLMPLLTMPVSPCPLVFVWVHLKRTWVHSENVPLGPHTRVWNFVLVTNTSSTSTNALGNLTAPLFFLPGFVPGHSSSQYVLLDTVLANCQSILHVSNVLKILLLEILQCFRSHSAPHIGCQNMSQDSSSTGCWDNY